MESYMTKDDDIIQSLINQLSLKPTDGDSIEALADKLRKQLYETALAAELENHLGYKNFHYQYTMTTLPHILLCQAR